SLVAVPRVRAQKPAPFRQLSHCSGPDACSLRCSSPWCWWGSVLSTSSQLMPPEAAEWVVAVFELHRCPDPAVAAMAVADTAAVVTAVAMAVATAAAVWASLS
ncbi:hypothetical protein N9R98_01155, partial [bacterium]|nr:hypothetical protein [bacterium]